MEREPRHADAPYLPIACGLHDRLLDWATRRVRVEVRYRDSAGNADMLRDVLVDIWTEGGAEYLRTESGLVIRLDALLQVEDVPFDPPGPSTR